jgi:hypothetical protein
MTNILQLNDGQKVQDDLHDIKSVLELVHTRIVSKTCQADNLFFTDCPVIRFGLVFTYLSRHDSASTVICNCRGAKDHPD